MVSQKKSLVIVESPGKIKTISKVLGKGFIVKASVGHVRDLSKSRKNDEEGAIVTGVASDFTPQYIKLENKKKVLEDLAKASKGVERIYLCPDPDREGEAIAWHLQEALKLEPERTYRVTFDEITPRGIRQAFQQPRKINMDLVNAQQARRVLDRIVGYKLSPLLWEKISRGLSAGRVQSIAVKLIVEREREIEAFKAEEYWKVGAIFSHQSALFRAELRALGGCQLVASADDLKKYQEQDKRLSSSGVVRTLLKKEAEVRALVKILEKARYQVTSFGVKEVVDRPYPPFATSQLQQAAVNRLGFDARRCMRIAQELYQGVSLGDEGSIALITYMRTDSFKISQDALVEARDLIASRFGQKFLPERPNFYSSRKGAQEAHECIRPTHVEKTPQDVKPFLSEEQYKLYKLIWERFVACQMAPAVFDASSCDIAAEGAEARHAVFRATGRVLKFEGWLAVYGGAKALEVSHIDATAADREKGDELDEQVEEAEPGPQAGAGAQRTEKGGSRKEGSQRREQILPVLKVGDRPDLKRIEPSQHFTQPPPRYTEASLIKTLEREGIGRPSTYATIISTIQDRMYVDKTAQGGRGSFRATDLGMAVNDSLVDYFDHSILDLGFTRKMESELDKIEEAHLDWRTVLEEFYGPFTKDLNVASKKMVATKGQGEKTEVACPECGTLMEKRLNRFGFYLRCAKAPECKGMLRVERGGKVVEREKPLPTGLKCDKCGGDMVKTKGRFGEYLACERYLLKQCSFTMKLNKEGHPVRKFEPLATAVECAKCKAPMVVRITWRGKNRRPFLSCTRYPKCRAAQDLPEDLKAVGETAVERWQAMDARNKADLKVYLNRMAEHETAVAGAP